jgi:hypothetical protein
MVCNLYVTPRKFVWPARAVLSVRHAKANIGVQLVKTKQSASVSNLESSASKRYGMDRCTLGVDLHGAGCALKCVLRTMANRGIYTADCHIENGRAADCSGQQSKLESCLPYRLDLQAASNPCYLRAGLGNSHCTWELFAKGLFLLWDFAVLRAEFGKTVKSSPTILNREPPCLMRRIFLTIDFKSVKYICGGLFTPKLTTNNLSWHTISWHYPFNLLNMNSVADKLKVAFRWTDCYRYWLKWLYLVYDILHLQYTLARSIVL